MSWWQRGVVYQVYPRSFADADGDGVGDLRGMTNRLDHLVWLGVDAVWLSPIYRSPMKDFGYDISDHTAIDPRFGSLADFDALVAAAHDRGLRVLLDFVPDHTSTASVVRGVAGLLPLARPGGRRTAQQLAERVRRLGVDVRRRARPVLPHAYLRGQPDLDWRNPAVREAMLGVLRFWIDRGVDGFRVDALRQVLKDPSSATTRPTRTTAAGCRSTTRCCPRAAPTTTTSRPWSPWRTRSPSTAGT